MNLDSKIKTLEGWYKFAEKNEDGTWNKYCLPGELVNEEVYDYFLEILPLHSMKSGYLQVGEPYSHKLNPVIGKYQATYATFVCVEKGIWRYCGNCFTGGFFDVEMNEDTKTLQEFMKATYCINFGSQRIRPRIVCKDGFTMSVQAGSLFYSNPRKDLENGEYQSYEIGYPSLEDELLKPFAEEFENFIQQVYPYVPIEIIEQVIKKHGGLI